MESNIRMDAIGGTNEMTRLRDSLGRKPEVNLFARHAEVEKMAMHIGALKARTEVLEWAIRHKSSIPAEAIAELNAILREGE